MKKLIPVSIVLVLFATGAAFAQAKPAVSNRILVLRGRPGVLAREIPVDLPHPRPRGDADLGRRKDRILQILDLDGNHPPLPEYEV